MSEILLKSLNYKIGNEYHPHGTYVGIYKNSYLIFIKRINTIRFQIDNLDLNTITNFPTQNEVSFISSIHKKFPFKFIKEYQRTYLIINDFGVAEHDNQLFPELVLTVDRLYYNPFHKKNLMILLLISRIYE